MKAKAIKMFLIINSVFIGLLFSGLSVPLIKGKVPPNESYGFRTEKTMSSEEVWYKANTYIGKEMFKAGLVLITASIVSLIFIKKLKTWVVFVVHVLSIATILAIAILRSVSYLNGI